MEILHSSQKNPEHNKRVKELSELIPGTQGLTTPGIFSPDNFATLTTYGYASFFATLGAEFLYPPPHIDFSLTNLTLRSLGAGSIVGLCALAFKAGPYSAKEHARYLDSKVQELILKE